MTDQQLAQIIWDYMRYEQPLEKTDLIFALGSDDIRIADHTAKLYHNGLAPKILFSGSAGEAYRFFEESEAEIFRKRAIELGVPGDVILVEDEASNTGENVTKSYELLRSLGPLPASMILVQKPFMLRRTYATFMKQWPSEIKPEIITSAINLSFEEYVKDPHYTFERTINIMIGDLQRIIEYPGLGFQIEQDVPADVQRAFKALIERGYTERLLSK